MKARSVVVLVVKIDGSFLTVLTSKSPRVSISIQVQKPGAIAPFITSKVFGDDVTRPLHVSDANCARFNSYTQQICIDDAIIVHEQNGSSESPHHCLPGEFPPDNADAAERDDNILSVEEAPQPVDNSLQRSPRTRTEKAKASNVNQTVTYTAHAIDNLADVVDTLNISSSATISYASSHSNGSASFVKENSISESDINFIVSVKVTNELPINPTQLEFRPLDGLEPDQFSEVYGDCFIAGFLEGGAFSAIVSIKVQDKNKISRVKMAAEMQLSATKYFQPLSGAMADSENQDIWTDTELSVSVTWSGGGSIKKPKVEDKLLFSFREPIADLKLFQASWNLPTIIQAANDFPAQVSKYPQRTQAILMSYNSVRSFHEFNAKATRPFPELYTADLLSAFIAYKSLWKLISKIIKNPDLYQAKEVTDKIPNPIDSDPISLNQAKIDCRKGMTMILDEIYIGTSGNSDNNGLSCASSVPDEMNMINKYVSRPSFLPQLGENQGGNFPRVTNTFYSTASSTSPDGQVGLPIPNNTVESSDAVENTTTNDTWVQMKPNRSCIPAPRFIASANLSLLSMVCHALLLKCCFRRTKKVKFRTPRESSNQEYPIRQDQVAVMPGATTSP
ncbi:conserved hypothetical protein [Histoplasma capsulatum G186AR]|uniref:Uncharacterized protein n=1 Tax=Ajellomyces capsulatus (strain G186AR / H82 / ATCC MYA-2454 / RMSCC 2432) TaxID=447093 RepID=C0NXI8_AJECG|nr:uncharacterized protein HCBG_08180 [Histoplasma capsulatum G186AR]EEH04054.1 conserved hypothetical protein [Histoplasma capsulatum G186AR]